MSTLAISYLFVPASRPERVEKALSTEADVVIVDLEDAVASAEKDTALGHLRDALESGPSRPVHVRINAVDSPWFERDLEALAALSRTGSGSLGGVVVPKAEHSSDLARVVDVIGRKQDREIVALIETAAGVANIADLARVGGLTRFAVGAADLSADLDVSIVSSTVDWVYAQLVVQSRVAGLAGPVASPPFEIRDLAAVESEAARLRGLGAAGQLCIHPAQIDAIHRGFRPSEASVVWARKVIEAATTGGATQVDGQMVDKPIRERAERILERVRS